MTIKKVLFLLVFLCIMMQGTWAQTKDATLIDGLYYVLNNEDKTAEVVRPSGFRYQGDIVVPSSVTEIESGAFNNCDGLTAVTLPEGLITIGAMSFVSCTALTTIYNYAVTPQEIDFYTFMQVPAAACTLYVPEESVELYKAAPVWMNFDVQAITGTGISPMVNGQWSMVNDAWYTLDGRRLMGQPTQRGIYIYKDKKTIK